MPDLIYRRALAATLTAGALIAVTAHPAQAQSVSTFVPKAGYLFNKPRAAGGTEAQQMMFTDTVVKTLDAMPAGSVARIATFDINEPTVYKAILRTYRRGVTVRVIFDGTDVNPAEADLTYQLGHDVKANRSYAIACQQSCGSDKTSVMHNKIFTASSTGSPRTAAKITMLGSANMTKTNGYLNWNQSQILTDPKIYAGVAGYFDRMRFDKPIPFTTVRGTSSRNLVYMWPSSSSANPTLKMLRSTRCTGGTKIRVAMFLWVASRVEEARLLAAKKKAGCDVAVLYVNNPWARTMAQPVVDVLWAGKVPMYNSYRDLNGDGSYDLYLHSKEVLVSGMIAGRRTQTVYSGSANWTANALQNGNETLLVDNSAQAFAAYEANWNMMRALAVRDVRRPIVTPPKPVTTQRRQAPDAREQSAEVDPDMQDLKKL
jgi:hypothetical protein